MQKKINFSVKNSLCRNAVSLNTKLYGLSETQETDKFLYIPARSEGQEFIREQL